MVGRLHPGTTAAQTIARLDSVFPGARRKPEWILTDVNTAAIPEAARSGMAKFAQLLGITVGLLLLIGCLTVGMLLLIRTEAHRRSSWSAASRTDRVSLGVTAKSWPAMMRPAAGRAAQSPGQSRPKTITLGFVGGLSLEEIRGVQRITSIRVECPGADPNGASQVMTVPSRDSANARYIAS